MYKCKKCNKSFKTQMGVVGHQRVHSENYEEVQKKHAERIIKMNNNYRNDNIKEYNKNPKYCLNCNKVIPYDKIIRTSIQPKFCDHSCSATYTNKLKPPKSKETRNKISKALSEFYSIPKHRNMLKGRGKGESSITSNSYFKKCISGKYSKVHFRTCSHCKCKFSSRSAVKYCNDHSYLYKNNNRNKYAFTFSIGKFPELFGHMNEQLKKYGMWKPNNTNGLTRDHKVSVNEAIRNNYDPYYIRHPLNCELMPWLDNNKKNTDSSLSYKELKKLVDECDLSTN